MLSHECKGEKFNVDYLQSPIHPVRARHPVTPPAGGRPRAEKRSRRAPLSMEHGAVATRRTDCCESFSPVLFSTQSPSVIRKMCGQRSMSPCTASYKPIRDLVDWVVWRYPVGPFFKEKDPARPARESQRHWNLNVVGETYQPRHPDVQSPHYFSSDLVHPWLAATVGTFAVTSEMSKDSITNT